MTARVNWPVVFALLVNAGCWALIVRGVTALLR